MSKDPVIKLDKPSLLYLLREKRSDGLERLYFSTERSLVFHVFESGKNTVAGTYEIPCCVLAEWSLKCSKVKDLAGLIRLFGGIFVDYAKASDREP